MAINYIFAERCEENNSEVDFADYIDFELLELMLKVEHAYVSRVISIEGLTMFMTNELSFFTPENFKFTTNIKLFKNIHENLTLDIFREFETGDIFNANISNKAIEYFIEEVADVIPLDCLINCSQEELNTMIDMYYQTYSVNDEIQNDVYKVYIHHMKNKIKDGVVYV